MRRSVRLVIAGIILNAAGYVAFFLLGWESWIPVGVEVVGFALILTAVVVQTGEHRRERDRLEMEERRIQVGIARATALIEKHGSPEGAVAFLLRERERQEARSRWSWGAENGDREQAWGIPLP